MLAGYSSRLESADRLEQQVRCASYIDGFFRRTRSFAAVGSICPVGLGRSRKTDTFNGGFIARVFDLREKTLVVLLLNPRNENPVVVLVSLMDELPNADT